MPRDRVSHSTDILSAAWSGVFSVNVRQHPSQKRWYHLIGSKVLVVRRKSLQRNHPGLNPHLIGIPTGDFLLCADGFDPASGGLVVAVTIKIASIRVRKFTVLLLFRISIREFPIALPVLAIPLSATVLFGIGSHNACVSDIRFITRVEGKLYRLLNHDAFLFDTGCSPSQSCRLRMGWLLLARSGSFVSYLTVSSREYPDCASCRGGCGCRVALAPLSSELCPEEHPSWEADYPRGFEPGQAPSFQWSFVVR